MHTIKRHSHAAKAAKLFVESLFTEPGVTIASADLTRRADRAGVAASSSVVVNAAQNLVKQGWLEQPARGFYRRPETTGPALISDPVPPSSETLEVGRLAGLAQQLRNLQTTVDDKLAVIYGVISDPYFGMTQADFTLLDSVVVDVFRMFEKSGRVEDAQALRTIAGRLHKASAMRSLLDGGK